MIARRRSGSLRRSSSDSSSAAASDFGSGLVDAFAVPAEEPRGDDRAGHEEQPEDDDELAPAEVERARRRGRAALCSRVPGPDAAGLSPRPECCVQVEVQVLQVPDDEQLESHDGGPGGERDEQAHASKLRRFPCLRRMKDGHEQPR